MYDTIGICNNKQKFTSIYCIVFISNFTFVGMRYQFLGTNSLFGFFFFSFETYSILYFLLAYVYKSNEMQLM